jgi:hypothetical protein
MRFTSALNLHLLNADICHQLRERLASSMMVNTRGMIPR